MISFLWPWAFALLPLPLLAWRWLPQTKRYDAALKVPFYRDLMQLSGAGSHVQRMSQKLLPLLLWLLLVCSVAQPLWIGDDQPVPISGRDLMLLIDVSGSMRKIDFEQAGEPADRLSVVKTVAKQFVDGRRGDRVGLILFGDKPYLRASPSHDHQAIKQLIDEAEIALAGESTAIGDAIGLSIKRMRDLTADSRVAILLTDGANNEGLIPPRQAARLAAEVGLRIYTIGVGASETPAPNPYGIWSSGNTRRFEREVLEEIAELTGGVFFHVLDTEGLSNAYRRLDQLEPALSDNVYKYFATPLYPWTLAAALAVQLVMLITRIVIRPFSGRGQ